MYRKIPYLKQYKPVQEEQDERLPKVYRKHDHIL